MGSGGHPGQERLSSKSKFGSNHIEDERIRHGIFDHHDGVSAGTMSGDNDIRINFHQRGQGGIQYLIFITTYLNI